ncbi:MAG: FAD synthase [Thermoplasmatales archaeon]|nr:FAD synthase [Thermoplasmatales archaeon]MCW6170450.1 FAD synthase [Thermoplasmatales archaeon]
MTKVMATGVFDILHLGHLHYLIESKKLGDELLVVVARDSTAMKSGKAPIFDEKARVALVSQLKPVDKAIVGHEGDIFQTVKENKPDIITLGYDQKFDDKAIEQKCKDLGLNTKVVRISKFDNAKYLSSSSIRTKLLEIIEGSL